MTKISEITECSECGSKSLTWGTHYKTNSGVPEGRLRSSEVQCLFVLGCDECSETLSIVSADKVAAALSAVTAERDQLRAEVEALRPDAERWSKCKTMPKEWWLEAMADAGRKGGRSLDESIDVALSQRAGSAPAQFCDDVAHDDWRRDGFPCPACTKKPAPAQDERADFEAYMLGREHPVIGWISERWFKRGDDPTTYANDYVQGAWVLWRSRPAQTEQQPVGWQSIVLHASELADMVLKGDAPQTAQRTARALLSMLAAPQWED